MKRRILVLLLALCLLAGLISGCGQPAAETSEPPAEDTAPATEPAAEETTPETREFTDSTGRTVTVPYEVTKVAISGPLTQVYAIPLVGDLMVGVSNYIAEDIALYLPEYISTLPELGQLYGGKGEMDLEALLAADPDVVIDVGDTKDGIAEDMDSLTEQTGIPFVHIDASVVGAPEAYRMLGELTGKQEEAAALSSQMQEGFDALREKAEDTGKTVYFEVSPLEWGLWTSGADTFLDELAQIVGLTNAFADVSGWAEISQEQVLARDPDYIVTTAAYYGEGEQPVEEIMSREGWQDLKAVKNDAVYNADADMTSRPGPRLLDAAQDLFDFVYGADEAAQPAA